MGRVRKGVYLDETLIEDRDNMLGAADARSRNEFIEKALKFYLGYLKTNQAEDLILDMRMVCVNQHKDNAETKDIILR